MPPSSNVYFGKLRAAHVDDPHGGCGAHDGPLVQGSPHVHISNRPLVREHDLPPCAGRPDHEPAVHCFVGTGGGSATKTIKHGQGRAAPKNGAPHGTLTHTSDPVDVATGHVFNDVFEFAAPALPGFPFERSCASDRAGQDGPLGWGWAHGLAQRLEHGAEGVTLHDAVGRRVLFPPLGLGDSVQHLDEKITLAQGDEGEFILERPDGLSLFFVDKLGTGLARLETVFDEGGAALLLEYEGPLLRRVSDSLGNVYRIESEDGLRWHAIVQEGDEDAPEQTLCRYQYDREGHLAAAGDALGQWWRYGYDHARRLARNTDRNGYSFFFEYDDTGRCVRTRGEDGLYDLSFSYLENPARTVERDAEGRTTTYEYTDLGLVSRVTDAGGHAETFTYEDADQVEHADALGRTTRYEYDPQGRVTARTAPGGGRSLVTHDGGGLASLTDAEGTVMARTVTPDGRLVVTSPAAPAPLLTVHADPDEDCLVLADGAGQESRLYLDEAGRLLAAETPLGRILTAGYDAQGNLDALADGAGRAVRFGYDPLGRLTAVEREGGTGLAFGYDAEGDLTHFTDGAGAVTRFDYRSFHQLHSVTTPAGNVTRFDYDNQGRLHRLTDPRRSAWQLDYDHQGRLERLLHPEGASETFAYDPAGQMRRRVARGGAGFDYDYDPDGNLAAIRCGDGTALAFAHDNEGRLTQASGPDSLLTFEYDGLGRLTRETQDGQPVGYAYDDAGRLASLTTPGGDTILYAYDADGALTGVTDWEGGRHAFTYGEDGAMLSALSPNGVLARFDYSPLGLPSAVYLGRAGEDAPLARLALSFGPTDALTEAADSALGRARYAYDADGRLTEVSGAAPEAFEYDDAGNLVRHGRQQWEYDAANRLVSGTDAHFRYDGDGNLVEDDGPDGRRLFTYDALGLLTRADLPGGVVAEYAYDPLGRRAVKRVTSGRGAVVETRWLWAGDVLLSEAVTDGDGESLEARDFLFAPGASAPLAQRVNGAVFCCHTDARGAPTRLTDGRGRVAWAASYSAYGEARVRVGSLREPLRLLGQYHDDETGLHQNRWRAYDPSRGRYLSPDPLGLLGGVNLYAYAAQDPVGQSDPLGLFPGVEALASRLLGAKLGAHAAQAYGQVQGLLAPHLSGGTPPFLPGGPSAGLGQFSGLLGHVPGLGGLLGHVPSLGGGVGGSGFGGLNVPGFGLQRHGGGFGAPALGLPGLPTPALPGLPGVGLPGLGGSLGGGLSGGLFPGAPQAARHTARRRAPAHHAPPPAQGAHACPKALAAQKAARAKALAFPAYACHAPAIDCFPSHTPAPDIHAAPPRPSGPAHPDDAAHHTTWQNLGPDLRGVGQNLLHLPAAAGTVLKAEALGLGNMAEEYGDGILEGDYYLDSLVDRGDARARDLAAKAGYERASDRAEARVKTAGQPLLDTASGQMGTLKDLTAAAADTAGGQPEEAKKVLGAIVPNTEQAFHDHPAQTVLTTAGVVGGAGGVFAKAGGLADAAGAAGAARRVLRGQAAAARMRERWDNQGRGRPGGPGPLALAHAGGGNVGNSTRALGKPVASAGRPGVMNMAGGAQGGSGGLYKIVQQEIADPNVQVGSGHPWTGAKEAPQWSNLKSTKAYGHSESRHGPKRTPADNIGRAAGNREDQGQWLKPDWIEAERVAPPHPGRYVIDFGRPIGRVYHPDGSVTENVTRAFIMRNADGTLKAAYPVTDTYVFK